MGENKQKWQDALSGISSAEAFSLINNPRRGLTQKQKDKLWEEFTRLKNKKYLDPLWWEKEDMPTKVVQEKLMSLPSHVKRS